MTLQLLGIKVIPLPLSPQDNFLPSIQTAKKLITPKTRAITLVTPNNPCGSIYDADQIRAFYALAKEHGIALVIDETYRDFVNPSETDQELSGKPHDLFEDEDWADTAISLFSFSKSYKLPGYRIGGIVANKDILDACRTAADCIQVCRRLLSVAKDQK